MTTSSSSPPTPAPPPEADCPPQTSRDLTVVTLNTHRSYGANGLERIATEISALDPDVVLLQEVDRYYPRTGGVDQAAWFAQRLGMHSAFGANVTRGRSQYGTAVLSRAPIVDQANTLLPNAPGGEQRGLLRVAIDLGHATISVYNAHLQNRLAGLREAQARAVATVLATDPRPRIIGGDFNAGPGTRTLGPLSTHVVDSWPESGSGPGGTVRGGSRIDYLMASRDLRPVESSVHRGSVSDHAAVRTRYDVAAVGSC
jgi:endonuclease/exonuclease/phosphatase family metal-dependent hydrolase